MSWFDEAVARRQREQRAAASAQPKKKSDALEPLQRQRQEVEALDPLLQRLLSEYGEHVYGKNLFQKRFLIRLEPPGKNSERAWNWHWHLYSLVRDKASVEVAPNFNEAGFIEGFVLTSGRKRTEVASVDEVALKDGLVSLYLQ